MKFKKNRKTTSEASMDSIQLVALGVVPCVQRATRKIELLTLDVDDSVLVHRLERAVVKAAVAPGIEAPLLLPPQPLPSLYYREHRRPAPQPALRCRW